MTRFGSKFSVGDILALMTVPGTYQVHDIIGPPQSNAIYYFVSETSDTDNRFWVSEANVSGVAGSGARGGAPLPSPDGVDVPRAEPEPVPPHTGVIFDGSDDGDEGRRTVILPGFDDDGEGGDMAQAALVAPTITVISRLAPIAIRGTLLAAIRSAGGVWRNLPGWVRGILLVMGVAEGTDIILDEVIGGIFSGGSDGPPGATVVGTWQANGVTFYRLSDGKLAVQNKMGRWKIWRPKKPIVLMPGGANDLRTLIRADKVMTRQAKQIRKMLTTYAPTRKAATKQPDVRVLRGDAGNDIIVSR